MGDTISQDTPMKQCKGPCGRMLPATTEFFYATGKNGRGLFGRCKHCYTEQSKAKRNANREAYRARQRASAARCKEHAREYCKANAEKIAQWHREYGVTHRNERREYERKYYREHPEKRRAIHHNRRARKNAIAGSYTDQDIQRQFKAQKGKCYWCSVRLDKYHVDHIVPVNREGSSNYPWNIVLSCPHCNVKRGDKLPHEWFEGNRLL